MKKTIALALVAFMVFNLAFSAFAEEEAPIVNEVIEEYVNTSSATVKLTISSSGTATIKIMCVGLPGTTHISSRTYLERWNGSSWSRVSINGASEIIDGISASSMLKTYTTTVGTGQYRATCIFTVTRGTDETITIRSTTVTH